MNDEYELYHHGVKGMKWGVRKKSISAQNRKIYRSNKKIKNGRKLLNRSGGSKSHAYMMTAGKHAAAMAIANIGVSSLSDYAFKKAFMSGLAPALTAGVAGGLMGGPLGTIVAAGVAGYNIIDTSRKIVDVSNAAFTVINAGLAARGIKQISDIHYASKKKK